MAKILKIQVIFILPLIGLGVGYFKTPYIQLQAEIAGGRLDYRALPVTEFTAGNFEVPAKTIQLGRLSVSVPMRAGPEEQQDLIYDPGESLWLRDVDGVTIQISAPSSEGTPRYRDVIDPPVSNGAAEDSVQLIAAAYAADCQNASLWMNSSQIAWLRQLLEVRHVLPPLADRIEVLRGPGVKGIISLATLPDGRPVMQVHYFSNMEDVSGTATLVMDKGSPRSMSLARAMIDSFRISS